MKRGLTSLLLLVLVGVTACSESSSPPADKAATSTTMAADLPADAPAPGTLLPATPLTPPVIDANGVTELKWEHLIPPGFEPEKIMAKYEDQISQIAEGSPEDEALLEKIVEEFNQAPSNPEWANKKIRLPGYISPLDEKDGFITEFLLVPYFGACIHQPPPPVNQTLLVRPQQGKSVRIEDIYQPVWVVGDMRVETTTTQLASAGYLIENAELSLYEIPEDQAEPGEAD